jgi:hypothetical protein
MRATLWGSRPGGTIWLDPGRGPGPKQQPRDPAYFPGGFESEMSEIPPIRFAASIIF